MSLLLRLPDDLGLHVLSYLDLYTWCQFDSASCSSPERTHSLRLLGKLKSISGAGVPHTAIAWLAARCPLIAALDIYAGHVAVQATVESDDLNKFKCIRSLILNYGVFSHSDFFNSLKIAPSTLHYLRIEDGGWVAAADIHTFIQRCTELRHLYFENDPHCTDERGPSITDNNLISGLQCCDKLSDLELIHVSPAAAALEQLWSLGRRLRHLDIQVSAESALSISAPQLKFDHMVILRLSGVFEDHFARSLVAGRMPCLKHLTIYPKNSLEFDDLFKSFASLCLALESLSLNSWCFFSAQSLIDNVLSCQRKFRVLDLRVDREAGVFPASLCDEVSHYIRRRKRRTKLLLSDDVGTFRKDMYYKKVKHSECYDGEIIPMRRAGHKGSKFKRAAGAYGSSENDMAADVVGNIVLDSSDSDVSFLMEFNPVSEAERGKLVAAIYDDIMG